MYFLMNKDRVVAEFTLPEGSFSTDQYFKSLEGQPLPIGFDYIDKWLENRKASKHNAHLRQIMNDCGCGTSSGFIAVTHAASINDTYWVRSDHEDIQWDQVSFYRNPFNETISRLAFEGVGLYGVALSTTSPELSTEGSFRKCWRREDNGEIFLYKRGTSLWSNAGLEPYCEAMASEIAEKLTERSVHYDLVRLHGELASRCKSFTDETYGYVPIIKFPIRHEVPGELLRFYEKLGDEDLFRRMLVLDALTFNVDRHPGNYGVIVDNETQKPIRMAPIFDLNMALLPYVVKDEFQDIGKKMLDYGPRIGDDFTRIGQESMTGGIRSDLIGLKGFRFSFRGDEKFPEWRVKKMEELVNRQIEALLSKEILHTKDVFVPNSGANEITLESARQLAERLDREIERAGIPAYTELRKTDGITQYAISLDEYQDTDIVINLPDLSVEIERGGNAYDITNMIGENGPLADRYMQICRIADTLAMPLEKQKKRNRQKDMNMGL